MKRVKVSVDKKMILIVTVLIILTMSPLMFQGIICNDELLTRYWRKLGIQELLKHYFSVAFAGGRRMGAFVDVRLISFISSNMFVNRMIDIFLLLTAVALFIYFIYKVQGSKGFSCFLGIMLIVCLPITFEHGAPNAFVAVVCVPLILLIVSLLSFWKYLLSLKRKYLVTSMVLYLIAMMQYEFVVTYMLMMYVLIIKYQYTKEKFDLRETFKTAIIPTAVSMLYIFAYFLMQKSGTSNYSGTTVGFVSIKNSLEIIMVLAKSSFPGYFLFNDKYKYLQMVYSQDFKYVNFLVIIVFLIILVLSSVLALIVKDNGKNTSKWSWAEIGVALLFMFIPSLPNSISSLYQGNVTESFFTWLPVSLFLYFSATYLICRFIWKILTYIYIYIYRYKIALFFSVICISFYAGQIQFMNYIIANQQYTDFIRLQTIENMFDLNLWKDLEGLEFCSEDIYETRNLLAVHEKFWSQYLHANGVEVDVEQGVSEKSINLYYLNDDYFILTDKETVIVCSPKVLTDYHEIKISKEQYLIARFQNGTEDSGYYIYCFYMDGVNVKEIPLQNAVNQFRDG